MQPTAGTDALAREALWTAGAFALPVLCGALCGWLQSGAARLAGIDLLRALAVWLVADMALGGVWTQLARLKACALALTRERTLPREQSAARAGRPVIPYAEPGSAARRIDGWLHAQRANRGWVAPAGLALGAAALAATLGTFVGPYALLVSASGLGVLAIATLVVRRPEALASVGRGVQVTAAWFGVLSVAGSVPRMTTALWPALTAGAWAGAEAHLRHANSAVARWAARISYAAAVALLLWHRQPLPAAGVALAAFGAEAPARGRDGAPRAGARIAWLASVLLLALAARYWS